jgi:pyrimidine operon attenuation protein / uracil phosphoribosyltransferase
MDQNTEITLLQHERIERAIKRIAMQVLEDIRIHGPVVVVGLNQRGFSLSGIIAQRLSTRLGYSVPNIALNVKSEQTSFDSGQQEILLKAGYTLIVDDVLFSGSSMMRAIRTVMDTASPHLIRTAVLVDRGHRRYPIQPDFYGISSPTKLREHVQVQFDENGEAIAVVLLER